MGRSRIPRSIVIEDYSGRTRRSKRIVSSSGENLESAAAGQRTNEGKRARFHCNYCNKDITGKIRIKCAVCPDFDLCLECFSVGAEITPHNSNHPYRVMDKLSFPLLCPDWNADEEMLLLEGLEMYGFGNWAEVAEHVGTHGKDQCVDHYNTAYMNSPCFPLPDMSHTAGKNRDELLAVAKEQETAYKVVELSLKEQPAISPTIKSVGVKKPKASSNEGPPLLEISGYNPRRREFDPEYDNEAEKAIAELEFKDTDTADEREIKLRMLHIYGQRIDERKGRKDFILERGLLHPDPLEKDLDPAEKELYEQYKVFMRLLSKEEHEELIKVVIAEHRTRKRIQEILEARAAGCHKSAQAEKYLAIKKSLIAEEKARMNSEGSSQLVGLSGTVLHKAGGTEARGSSADPYQHPSSTASASASSSSSFDRWDISGLPGAELLSEPEKRLCLDIKLIPNHYLRMLEAMSMEIFRGGITKKSDAHRFFSVDPNKVDKIYDMLVRKGIVPHSSN
ncbi:hypothetical protein MKW94_024061 [Papaver nudicaule]|uniref:Transcriptional adapter n=1 Tax=Papaver nudicaule TaxID=74823 RepID=A0AA41RUI2_PAPNU|nr:hypothetical protein [Papaver nudicaule]